MRCIYTWTGLQAWLTIAAFVIFSAVFCVWDKFSRGSAVNIGFDSGSAVADIIINFVCSIMARLSIVTNTYNNMNYLLLLFKS